MTKKYVTTIVFLMILVLATSCEENFSSGIIGTWKGHDVACGGEVQLTFHRDKNLDCSGVDDFSGEEYSFSGIYTITEDNIIIMDAGCCFSMVTWKVEALEGDNLFLSNEMWGSTALHKVE